MPTQEYKYNSHDHPERVYYLVTTRDTETPSNSNPFPDTEYKYFGPVYSINDVNALLVQIEETDYYELYRMAVHVRCYQGETSRPDVKASVLFYNNLDFIEENIDGERWAERYGPLPYPPEPVEQIIKSHIHYRLTGYSQHEKLGRESVVYEDCKELWLAVYRLSNHVGYGTMSDGKRCKEVPLEVIAAVIDCLGRFDTKKVIGPDFFYEYAIERISVPYSE